MGIHTPKHSLKQIEVEVKTIYNNEYIYVKLTNL